MEFKGIQELTAIIAANVDVYSSFLKRTGQPLPSHQEQSAHEARPCQPLPEDVANALEIATEASYELHNLLLGSVGRLIWATTRVCAVQTYSVNGIIMMIRD